MEGVTCCYLCEFKYFCRKTCMNYFNQKMNGGHWECEPGKRCNNTCVFFLDGETVLESGVIKEMHKGWVVDFGESYNYESVCTKKYFCKDSYEVIFRVERKESRGGMFDIIMSIGRRDAVVIKGRCKQDWSIVRIAEKSVILAAEMIKNGVEKLEEGDDIRNILKKYIILVLKLGGMEPEEEIENALSGVCALEERRKGWDMSKDYIINGYIISFRVEENKEAENGNNVDLYICRKYLETEKEHGIREKMVCMKGVCQYKDWICRAVEDIVLYVNKILKEGMATLEMKLDDDVFEFIASSMKLVVNDKKYKEKTKYIGEGEK